MTAARRTTACIRCGGPATTVPSYTGNGPDVVFCNACGESPKECYCQVRPYQQSSQIQAADRRNTPAAVDPEARTSRLDQLRNSLLDTGKLDSLPDPRPLIDGILYRDTLAWLHGKPGSGKSFIALDWACCISVGLPWQDCEVTKGAVLYVIAEGVTGLRQRVRAWEDWTQTATRVTFLPIAVQLMSPIDQQAIMMLATELEPVLIVIDTQARVTVGADENSARDMGELVAAIDKIRLVTDACILLVHHESRAGENMRGSTALEGAAATLIRVTKDGPHLRLDNTKQKDSLEFETMRLRLTQRLESAVVQSQNAGETAEELTRSEERILETLRDSFGTDGATGSNLFDVAQLTKPTFYRALNRLVMAGVIVNTGTQKRRHYVLAADLPKSSLNESHSVSRDHEPSSLSLTTPIGVGLAETHEPIPCSRHADTGFGAHPKCRDCQKENTS